VPLAKGVDVLLHGDLAATRRGSALYSKTLIALPRRRAQRVTPHLGLLGRSMPWATRRMRLARQGAQHLGMAQHLLGEKRTVVAHVEALYTCLDKALQLVRHLVRVVFERRAFGGAGAASRPSITPEASKSPTKASPPSILREMDPAV
jgi:hypothetical protein